MKSEHMPGAPADTQQAWQALHTVACQPYRQAGRWAWHWARGKLGRDPVFRGMLERGDLLPKARVVYIGCGQGLMASLLQACAVMQAAGQWPAGWPRPASASSYTGIELMPKDVARARRALASLPLQPQFICMDMCQASVPPCDVVATPRRAALRGPRGAAGRASQGTPGARAPQGRLLLRVGDAANQRGFAVSQWVDHVVTVARG